MLPEFPQFKNLELLDKESIELHTKKFPPYSDFNFISMWSWDIKGETRISKLNGNLVVKFNDYITGEPFYSFLGDSEVDNTVEKLLELSKKEGLKVQLKLISEESSKNLDNKKYKILEDRDHFDYIYDLEKLSKYAGGEYSQKRNEVSHLLSNNQNITTRELDLRNPDLRKMVTNLFHKWVNNKKNDGKEYEEHEELAFNKILFLSDNYRLICVGLFRDTELLAFKISELIESGYALGHASKSDTSIKGTNALLMKADSEILSSYGRKLFNFEQDLGLQNLRDGKSRFKPITFLKKYIVSFNS
ncbi:MAG: phosphatidylglycerol lysyltransferase domain-containing protein [Candidatus Nomurabacteria bacterium]|nr:phosphatidylglycerol lysyltransferase domain-containing protein [Candidatus Nomurabacteria bacterium]